jgi:hypothetical protein
MAGDLDFLLCISNPRMVQVGIFIFISIDTLASTPERSGTGFVFIIMFESDGRFDVHPRYGRTSYQIDDGDDPDAYHGGGIGSMQCRIFAHKDGWKQDELGWHSLQ